MHLQIWDVLNFASAPSPVARNSRVNNVFQQRLPSFYRAFCLPWLRILRSEMTRLTDFFRVWMDITSSERTTLQMHHSIGRPILLFFHRLNLSGTETYLDDRASKGFAMLFVTGVSQTGYLYSRYIFVIWQISVTDSVIRLMDSNRARNLPTIDGDLTKPNEPYWAHVDTVVEMAYQKGIRVAMVPAWGSYVHSSSKFLVALDQRMKPTNMQQMYLAS